MTLRIFASLLVFLALAVSATALAQATDYTPRITVTPLVAPPGVPRTIAVSGRVLVGCYSGFEMTTSEPPGGTGRGSLTLGLKASNLPGFCFSPPGFVAFNVTTTYTPTVAGTREIVMYLPGLSEHYTQFALFGFGEIVTSESDTQTRGGTDISGAWYDPARNGSGFAFHHSHDGSGVLAGTFYGFDNAGRPYWYLIQSVRWSSATRFSASLVEITSQPGSCPFIAGCNRLMQAANVVGTVYGEVMENGHLNVGFWLPAAFQFGVSESFDLQRLNF